MNNPKNAENTNSDNGASIKSKITFSGIKKNGFIIQLNEIMYEISESQKTRLNACFPLVDVSICISVYVKNIDRNKTDTHG